MTNEVTNKFTYDYYEKEFGDGFYPKPAEDESSGIIIKFRREDAYWVQASGDSICGLDGEFGIQTLNALNKKDKADELQVTTKMCMTRMKQQGVTHKVLSTPLNELSKEEFVFRVVDEMANCEWKAQAEYIMSLVGPKNKPGCIGIKNTFGKILYPKNKY